jgi:hypothetical protein
MPRRPGSVSHYSDLNQLPFAHVHDGPKWPMHYDVVQLQLQQGQCANPYPRPCDVIAARPWQSGRIVAYAHCHPGLVKRPRTHSEVCQPCPGRSGPYAFQPVSHALSASRALASAAASCQLHVPEVHRAGPAFNPHTRARPLCACQELAATASRQLRVRRCIAGGSRGLTFLETRQASTSYGLTWS